MNNFKHVDELVKTAQNTRKSKDFQKVADCFEPLIKSTAYRYARTYKNTPYELQDFDSVINYIFTKLIVSFDWTKNKFFSAYIKQFLNYELSDHMKKLTRKRDLPMNYNQEWIHEVNTEVETRKFSDYFDLEKIKSLTKDEKQVISLSAEGYSIKEISSELEKTSSAISTIKSRAIVKLRAHI